jgi:hypothetical protein
MARVAKYRRRELLSPAWYLTLSCTDDGDDLDDGRCPRRGSLHRKDVSLSTAVRATQRFVMRLHRDLQTVHTVYISVVKTIALTDRDEDKSSGTPSMTLCRFISQHQRRR